MARKKLVKDTPLWVLNMGKLSDGETPDPTTGEIYPLGQEIADPNPVAMPSGMRRPPSLQEQMDELFRIGKMRREAEAEETIDEANDFDIDDYFGAEDGPTAWQTEYDPLLGREISPAEFHEKYKSGELLEELKARFTRLEREEDIEEVITRLEAGYKDSRKPSTPPASQTPPTPSQPPAGETTK